MKRTYHLGKAKRSGLRYLRDIIRNCVESEKYTRDHAWDDARAWYEEQIEKEIAEAKPQIEAMFAEQIKDFNKAMSELEAQRAAILAERGADNAMMAKVKAQAAKNAALLDTLKLLIAGNPDEQIAYLESQFKAKR